MLHHNVALSLKVLLRLSVGTEVPSSAMRRCVYTTNLLLLLWVKHAYYLHFDNVSRYMKESEQKYSNSKTGGKYTE